MRGADVIVIGPGNMGSALAKQIAKAGHSLVITSKDASKGSELARELGATFTEKAAT